MKKYTIELSQEEMDQLVYALVLLKVVAINCLESRIGNQVSNSKRLATACALRNCAARLSQESPALWQNNGAHIF